MPEKKLSERRFQPEYLIQMIFVHTIVVFFAVDTFTWWALPFAYLTAALTAYSMGIFHHMYLSHTSFHAKPALEWVGVLLGTLTWRGPMAAPIRYAAMHRVHHMHSDKACDPHSPQHGLFHALLGWNWYHSAVYADFNQYSQLVPQSVAQNKAFRFMDRNVHFLQLLYGGLLFAIGALIFDEATGFTMLIYGVFVKTLIVVYSANLVDVINHTIGYRNYETDDFSTNSFLMSALHLGGAISWHNNHHAYPGFFTVRKNWWEFDMHYQFLRLLALMGWVKNIRVRDEVQIATSPQGIS